jgi:acetyl esterase/lipase
MPPVHIVHGERDTLTPLSGARRFCERVLAGGAQCQLVVYPGVGHLLTRNLANQESDFDPDPAATTGGPRNSRSSGRCGDRDAMASPFGEVARAVAEDHGAHTERPPGRRSRSCRCAGWPGGRPGGVSGS